jgi:hypothetical protein
MVLVLYGLTFQDDHHCWRYLMVLVLYGLTFQDGNSGGHLVMSNHIKQGPSNIQLGILGSTEIAGKIENLYK